MNHSSYTLISGPKITLLFLPMKNEILQIEIIESSNFTFSFFVDLPGLLISELLNWQKAYAHKEPLPVLNFPRQNFPPFTQKVHHALGTIPFGETLSYCEIAIQAGNPKAARAVGNICRLNKWPLFIPCHRVLPKNGSIGNYAFGASIKQILLAFESVT
jgi:O-6-methylguanine DNA methyltransferase